MCFPSLNTPLYPGIEYHIHIYYDDMICKQYAVISSTRIDIVSDILCMMNGSISGVMSTIANVNQLQDMLLEKVKTVKSSFSAFVLCS